MPTLDTDHGAITYPSEMTSEQVKDAIDSYLANESYDPSDQLLFERDRAAWNRKHGRGAAIPA